MRTIITSLVILFIMGVNAQSQGPGQGQGGPGGKNMPPVQRAENLVKKLEQQQMTFSVEERASMVEIFRDFFVKIKNMKQGPEDEGTAEQKEEKITQMKEERNQKVKELLGEERYTKYIEYMETNEPKDGPPQDGKGPKKDGPPQDGKGPKNKPPKEGVAPDKEPDQD